MPLTTKAPNSKQSHQNRFSSFEPDAFKPILNTLLGDYHYMHLADLTSYLEADQKLLTNYVDEKTWKHKAIINVASSGKFSSDRTIREYADGIWNVEPCPVE